MDDFIKSIKEEVKTQESTIEGKPLSNYRELFTKLMVSTPVIKIESVLNGDIIFSTSVKDMGLSCQDVQKFKTEIYSYLFVNFVGELLVRENINKFGNVLTEINKNKYTEIVNGHEHKKFGIKIIRNRFHFCFHISLIQSILTEDFHREVRKSMERS